jgi:hypothetical protein
MLSDCSKGWFGIMAKKNASIVAPVLDFFRRDTTRVKSSMVTFNKESIQKFAQIVGLDTETMELRGNRDEQVSTGKLRELIRSGLWIPSVATIRFNTVTSNIADGGNTFRSMFYELVIEESIEEIDCMLLESEEFDFRGYNQIEAKRNTKTVLELKAKKDNKDQGWGQFKSQLFTLACLRSKSLNVGGGGSSGKTWRGIVRHSADSIIDIFDHDDTLKNLVSIFKLEVGEANRSLWGLCEFIKTEVAKKFNEDNDGALLTLAIYDELVRTTDSGDPILPDDTLLGEVVDKLYEIVVTHKGKLLHAWPDKAKPGVAVDRQGKYSILCGFVRCAFNTELNPSTVIKPGLVPKQGFAMLVPDDTEDIEDIEGTEDTEE